MALLSQTVKAQIDSEQTSLSEFVEKTKSYFDTIKKEDYMLLVPYAEGGKWGYLHKESLKKVTPAFANYLNFYKGDYRLGYVRDSITFDEFFFSLNNEGKVTFEASEVGVMEVLPPITYSRAFPQELEKKSSKKGYEGFEYKKSSVYIDITAYSDLYESYDPRTPLLIPIKIDGKVYAIAGKKTKDPDIIHYGIIDSLGKPLKGFKFVHKNIRPVIGMKDTENTWFMVQDIADQKDQYSYINQKGKYKLKKELSSDIFNIYKSSKNHYPYYEIEKNILGYAITENSLFDLYEMKKINVVSMPYKILSIDYATTNIVKGETILEQRKKSNLYIWVQNEQEKFYMDLKKKQYKVSK